MKILIIDDSTINNILLQSLLEDEGYETTFILNGHDALKTINTFKPDVILLDIMMPDISGFDVMRKLKENSIQIPVITISAFKDKKYEKLAMSLGASAYLHKPVKSSLLFQTIRYTSIAQNQSN